MGGVLIWVWNACVHVDKVYDAMLLQVAVLPVQLDFLKQLPVDLTILLLHHYIAPADLLK